MKYAYASDPARAAKGWLQLKFISYHPANLAGPIAPPWEQFERSARMNWVTDPAEIPARHGVNHVYGGHCQI